MRIGLHWHYQNLFNHAVDKDSSTDCAFQPFYNWDLFLRPAIGGCWINESEGRPFDSWFKSYQFLKRKKRDAPVKFPLFPNACCTSWYLGRVVRLPSPATEGLDASIRKPTRLTSSTVTFSIRDKKSSFTNLLSINPLCEMTNDPISISIIILRSLPILWNSSWDDFLLLRPKTCLKTKNKGFYFKMPNGFDTSTQCLRTGKEGKAKISPFTKWTLTQPFQSLFFLWIAVFLSNHTTFLSFLG